MSREDSGLITVSVDNVQLGTFDKFSGGSVDSEEAKYKPGGGVAQVSLGGTRNVENVTVSRLYRLERDHPRVPFLIGRVGKGKVKVTKQPLDTDNNAYGRPNVYKGTLKQVTLPDIDSSSNDPALLELEVTTDGTVS